MALAPMTPAPDLAPEDNWYGVQDRKKRKQIQDRLAQRARRRRLAEAKQPLGRSNAGAGRTRDVPRRKRTYQQIPSPSESGISSSSSPEQKNAVTAGKEMSHDHTKAPQKAQDFLSALFETGRLLGLECGNSFPQKSKPAGPEIPASLHPTLLQQTTVHWQWIDRFPFADFRDEMIIASGNIAEEDFLWDLYHMETFKLRPGAKSWDPTAYTMCSEFQEKWGWLFPSFSRSGSKMNEILHDQLPLLIDPLL